MAATSRIDSSASSISSASNRIGSMLQMRSHSTSRSSSSAKRSDGFLREPQQLRERVSVEVPLVEQLLGRLDDGGDDPGLRHDAARGADRAPTDLRGDRADLERELRRAGERVAALVHRRRAGVRRLAAPRDLVALDAEGAEDDSERQVHRLEHGALLDVQLEIGDGVLELLPRVERAVEVDAVRRDGVGKGRRRRRPCAAAARPGRSSSRPRRSSRRANARSARPPRPPS